jgi:hypothetical protein
LDEAEWRRGFINELVESGFVYRNYNSQWASPAMVVRKPEGGFRLVIDLREVNRRSIATYWPMPFQESIVQRLGKAKIFFKLDLFKGFWLLPLAEECQEMF